MSLYTILKLDGHAFEIPTDPVKCFHFIRNQTITSYRAVANGKPTPRDLAFLFGTATSSSEKHKDDASMEVEEEEEVVEENEVLVEGGEETEEEEVEEEEEVAEEAEVEEEGETVDEEEVLKKEKVVKRKVWVKGEREPDESEYECDDSNDSSPKDNHSSKIQRRNALRTKLLSRRNKNMFVGNYRSIEDAIKKTGLSLGWLRARYVDGQLMIDGRLANVTVRQGRERCRRCIDAEPWAQAVCFARFALLILMLREEVVRSVTVTVTLAITVTVTATVTVTVTDSDGHEARGLEISAHRHIFIYRLNLGVNDISEADNVRKATTTPALQTP